MNNHFAIYVIVLKLHPVPLQVHWRKTDQNIREYLAIIFIYGRYLTNWKEIPIIVYVSSMSPSPIDHIHKL